MAIRNPRVFVRHVADTTAVATKSDPMRRSPADSLVGDRTNEIAIATMYAAYATRGHGRMDGNPTTHTDAVRAPTANTSKSRAGNHVRILRTAVPASTVQITAARRPSDAAPI